MVRLIIIILGMHSGAGQFIWCCSSEKKERLREEKTNCSYMVTGCACELCMLNLPFNSPPFHSTFNEHTEKAKWKTKKNAANREEFYRFQFSSFIIFMWFVLFERIRLTFNCVLFIPDLDNFKGRLWISRKYDYIRVEWGGLLFCCSNKFPSKTIFERLVKGRFIQSIVVHNRN